MTPLTLRCGATTCEVAPAVGGALLSLTVGGVPVLRPTSHNTTNVLDTACFPLVPFANRIDEGRFVFRGIEVILPEDPSASPHAHHGHGWRRSWAVDRTADHCADLSLVHERDEWPWRYRATQNITATAEGVIVTLTLYNLDDAPMPAGLGLHPFFPRAPDSQIALDARERLLTDERDIPTTRVPFVPGDYAVSGLEEADNLMLGGQGNVRVSGDVGITRINAIGAIGFHLYVPSGQPFFCVEPVTHAPNSFRSERPKEVLTPGAAASLQMEITHSLS
ncbi:MAG: aldose 1-epimerase [Sphingomonadales bacterium]